MQSKSSGSIKKKHPLSCSYCYILQLCPASSYYKLPFSPSCSAGNAKTVFCAHFKSHLPTQKRICWVFSSLSLTFTPPVQLLCAKKTAWNSFALPCMWLQHLSFAGNIFLNLLVHHTNKSLKLLFIFKCLNQKCCTKSAFLVKIVISNPLLQAKRPFLCYFRCLPVSISSRLLTQQETHNPTAVILQLQHEYSKVRATSSTSDGKGGSVFSKCVNCHGFTKGRLIELNTSQTLRHPTQIIAL